MPAAGCPTKVWSFLESIQVAITMSRSKKCKSRTSRIDVSAKREPSLASTIFQAAIAAQRAGRLDEAAEGYKKVLSIDQRNADAANLLGTMYQIQGKVTEAEVQFRNAIAIREEADFLCNLGNLLKETDRRREAEAVYRHALVLDPDHTLAHNNLGNLLADTQRFAEAEASYRRALMLNPNYAKCHCNLGTVLDENGRFTEAEAEFLRAIKLVPSYVEAYYNLANNLRAQNRWREAEVCYRQTLQFEPNMANAHCNLGIALMDQGRVEEALACFARTLELKPNHLGACGNQLFAFNYLNRSAQQCLEEARRYGRMAAEWVPSRFSYWSCEKAPDRLRVGLVSGDFRNHPVSYFLESLLANLDFDRIELFGYPTHPAVDEVTLRVKARFSAWKPIANKGDEATARLIHDDGVHILIDLSGHTARNRLPVFAWKPAPIQVSWLGYFATTGLAEMDYLIADPVTLPEAEEAHFTEKIWRLPEARLCFTAPDVDLPVSRLPALENGYVTFACFNNLNKMNDSVVALWARVLSEVPNSRLFLKDRQFSESAIRQKTMDRFAAQGLSPDRLITEGFSPRAEYLAAYHRSDIALDPFPFTGGTTSAESLWMGVPILTLAGDRFVSRQGVGLLTNAGLAEWIATDSDDYVRRAVMHSSDIEGLAAVRHNLRSQVLASPVFDAPRFARNLERALFGMWEEWVAGQDQVDHPPALRRQHPDTIEIISATRLSERDFWEKSALGISLERLKRDRRLIAKVAFENRRGLPTIYNERILAADGCETLVFIHDDVWIDDYFIADRVLDGLMKYDVLGVAGSRALVKGQVGWGFIDRRLNPVGLANLSGAVSHGDSPFSRIDFFGEVPAECELLDGVFFAVRKSALISSGVLFDPTFDFHFYDMDFCRSARRSGLRLSTWPISLTHQSRGNYKSDRWRAMCDAYCKKWED